MPHTPDILLYSATDLPRWRYSARYLLQDLLGLQVDFTTDLASWQQFAGPRLAYTRQPPDGPALHLLPHPLTAATDISEQALATSLHEQTPILCHVPPGGALPFDPFAATFYLLSRYEEYLPYTADPHDRFPAAISWAARANCLEEPIIWKWALLLWGALQEQYPRLRRPVRSYRFLPTYDVDAPWAFLHRGPRGLARAALDLVEGQWPRSRQRLAVWRGQERDPFDTFDKLRNLHREHGTRPRVFWLVARQRSRYDINPSPHSTAYRRLIRATQEWADPGLHPSYAAYQQPSLLEEEQRRLSEISGQAITHSRQHYLRLRLPQTYRQLLDTGIRHDYSMGYADAPGYRAGTSEPFYWFDLERNTVTELRVHPFVVMDVTLRKYLALPPEEAQERIQRLRAYCSAQGLSFNTLWHNSSFAPHHGWAGWEQVYTSCFS